MPTSPRSKPGNYKSLFGEFVTFYIRADVGIGPYDYLFDRLLSPDQLVRALCVSYSSFSAISAIRSMGNGGLPMGFMAMDMSFTGLSSAATRLELRSPQRLHL